MKQSVDFSFDDHSGEGEFPRVSWAVAITDDCDDCGDIRVELILEEDGRRGTGLVAHLTPATAKRLQSALATALRELGQG